jgi:putative PIN family toxin of toxin-antitoxin system
VRAVIDTNVLVSALMREGTPPAEVLDDVVKGTLAVLYDQRILDEYREVLARSRFAFEPSKAETLLCFIVSTGELIPDALFAVQLPDPDDQPFADVASAGGADVLITGNAKDFPADKRSVSFRPKSGWTSRSG